MFRTQYSDMAGIPEMFGQGLTHWNSVSRVLAMHWYHVNVQEFHEGRLITFVHMINDEVRLNDLLTNQSQELVVNDVQVVTPPWMNKCESWKMEKLTSVSVGFDKNGVVVCLVQVEGGEVYSDTHDRNFDASTLTDLRRVYSVIEAPPKTVTRFFHCNKGYVTEQKTCYEPAITPQEHKNAEHDQC